MRRRSESTLNIWPGFVDALSSLLIIVIFLLTLFALAHVTANALISGRDEALEQVRRQLADLSEVLRLERLSNDDLKRSLAEMSASLQATQTERDQLRAQRSDLESQAQSAGAESQRLQEALASEQDLTKQQRDQIAELTNAIDAMKEQMARLEQLLSDAETKAKADQAQIADLGKRLNLALAGRVEELARYRSEFFGRLREVLGNRPDIRIVGDRFVFQSEVLFASGSADLSPEGRVQIDSLAETLTDLSTRIPNEIPWVLRVDGHTDKAPISTPQFPSNWELSTARATAVVKALIEDGIPPMRLAAAGFGEYQPLDPANTPEAYRRNRRIELKLDQR
ncbi:MAG TPA: peptidoglycan -binding protein [Alphaproteobacteria bacterium]|jgi:chemotaxis protein MotB|nr:peptidoglycan -binding protein [Alphaproteobacteria bacterium]